MPYDESTVVCRDVRLPAAVDEFVSKMAEQRNISSSQVIAEAVRSVYDRECGKVATGLSAR